MRALAGLLLLLVLPPAFAEEPTAAEIEAWAKQVEAGILKHDASAFDRFWDIPAFTSETLSTAKLPKKLLPQLRTQLASSQIGPTLVEALKRGGSYTFLCAVSDPPRARFRLFPDDSGSANYHELYLKRRGTELCMYDVLVYTTGQRLSEMSRTMFEFSLAPENRQIAARGMPKMREAQVLLKSGDAAGALAAIKLVPVQMDRLAMVSVLRVQVAAALEDNEALIRASRDYEAKHPNSPALPLVLMDQYFVQERYDEVLKLIAQLEKRVGSDAYLDTLRASAYLYKGDGARANEFSAKAIAREPKLELAHLLELTIGLELKEWKRVAKQLTLLETEFGYEWGDLAEYEDYGEFMKSEAYQAWLKRKK